MNTFYTGFILGLIVGMGIMVACVLWSIVSECNQICERLRNALGKTGKMVH